MNETGARSRWIGAPATFRLWRQRTISNIREERLARYYKVGFFYFFPASFSFFFIYYSHIETPLFHVPRATERKAQRQVLDTGCRRSSALRAKQWRSSSTLLDLHTVCPVSMCTLNYFFGHLGCTPGSGNLLDSDCMMCIVSGLMEVEGFEGMLWRMLRIILGMEDNFCWDIYFDVFLRYYCVFLLSFFFFTVRLRYWEKLFIDLRINVGLG